MLLVSLCLIFLASTCVGNQIKTPLTVANPLHVIQHRLSDVATPDQDLVLLAQNLQGLVLNQKQLKSAKNDLCAKSIIQVIEDVKEKKPYAMQMLDSWSKVESGILEGNLKWAGLYYECERVKAPDYNGKYCTVYVGSKPSQEAFGLGVATGLTAGTCFPDTCSKSNITSIFVALAKSLNSTVIVNCPEQLSGWDGTDIVGIIVLIFLVVLVLASTMYDYASTMRDGNMNEFADKTQLFSTSVEQPEIKHGNFHRVMTSFSLIQNSKRLFNTKQRAGDINCLHGMRFLSMSWVILGHSFLFSVSFSNNIMFAARYMLAHPEFQAIANATFSVDSFFYLSGLLVAYLGLRQLSKRDGKMNVPMMYLHRYLRLTPPYAFMILMSMSLWPKFGNGPMWPDMARGLEMNCQKYWYSSLLYFSNLYPANMNEECYAWGWYLSNDTQFYLLSPLFLLLLYKVPVVGVSLLSFLMVGSSAITGAFSSHTKQQPQAEDIGLLAKYVTSPTAFPALTDSLSTFDAANNTLPATPSVYMSDLYTKPWCRIGAYLVGMITGYILHASNNKVKMPKIAALIGWVAAAGANCAIVYCLYPSFLSGQPLNNNTAAFYNAVSRPVWCMGLAWVTIACVSGYGGPVNALLSWKGFIPLSRLTYCSYLIHPLVIWWFVATSETLMHYSMNLIVMIFLATLVVTHLLAFVVAMLIEFPVIELLKILQNKDENSQPKQQNNLTFNNSVQFGNETEA